MSRPEMIDREVAASLFAFMASITHVEKERTAFGFIARLLQSHPEDMRCEGPACEACEALRCLR